MAVDSGEHRINPDRARLSLTLTKVFVAVGALAVGAFSLGGIWADQKLRLAGIDSRIGDLPSKREVREEIAGAAAAFDERVRELLRTATFHCPLFRGRGSNAWVECKVVFPTADDDERGRDGRATQRR